MNKISPTDTLSLSAMTANAGIFNFTLSGCSSMTDVVCRLRQLIGDFSGLISLRLRNITQGWSRRQSLMLRPAVTAPTAYPSLF